MVNVSPLTRGLDLYVIRTLVDDALDCQLAAMVRQSGLRTEDKEVCPDKPI